MISGKQFSPRLLQSITRLSFDLAAEVGDQGNLTGRIYDYGVATILGEITPGLSSLVALISLCNQHVHLFRKKHVDEIVFYLDIFHDGQCNFEINSDCLEEIGKLNATLAISCYEDDELVKKQLMK